MLRLEKSTARNAELALQKNSLLDNRLYCASFRDSNHSVQKWLPLNTKEIFIVCPHFVTNLRNVNREAFVDFYGCILV